MNKTDFCIYVQQIYELSNMDGLDQNTFVEFRKYHTTQGYLDSLTDDFGTRTPRMTRMRGDGKYYKCQNRLRASIAGERLLVRTFSYRISDLPDRKHDQFYLDQIGKAAFYFDELQKLPVRQIYKHGTFKEGRLNGILNDTKKGGEQVGRTN